MSSIADWDLSGKRLGATTADVDAGSSSDIPANGNGVQPSARAGSRQLILIIDQLEQLFTLCPDQKTQTAFIAALLQLVQSPRHGWQTSVVLTLRADFMGQALAHRNLADALQSATFYLGAMSHAELEAAVVRPAQARGIDFEAGLVQRILHDVGDLAGNLPLLEFALTALWHRQATGPLVDPPRLRRDWARPRRGGRLCRRSLRRLCRDRTAAGPTGIGQPGAAGPTDRGYRTPGGSGRVGRRGLGDCPASGRGPPPGAWL